MAANWFVGIPVPGSVLGSGLPPAPAGVRAFHPDDLHLTIAFLGPCGEARARAAWEALCWPIGPVDATLGEVVPMGSPHRYSALSALLDVGRGEVEGAMEACRGAVCAAARAALDPRPAKAHVTVARPSRKAGPEVRDAGLAWARSLDLGGARARLDRVALYTWSEDRSLRLFRRVAERDAGA
jgi:2'-5' RNA ligase